MVLFEGKHLEIQILEQRKTSFKTGAIGRGLDTVRASGRMEPRLRNDGKRQAWVR